MGITMARRVASSRAYAQGISFTSQVWKEGSTCVAYAPELDVSSCGDSPAQAKSRLREAVAAFLEEAGRMGTLSDILAEAGFRKSGRTYRARRILSRETVRLPLQAAS